MFVMFSFYKGALFFQVKQEKPSMVVSYLSCFFILKDFFITFVSV